MSDHNEVAIALLRTDYENLRSGYKNAEAENTVRPFDQLFDEVLDRDDFVVVVAHEVPWTNVDFSVVWIESFLKRLDVYQFLRIGEAYDDVEYINKAKGWDLIHPEYWASLGIAE